MYSNKQKNKQNWKIKGGNIAIFELISDAEMLSKTSFMP